MNGYLKNLLSRPSLIQKRILEAPVEDKEIVPDQQLSLLTKLGFDDKISAFFGLLNFLPDAHADDRLAFWRSYAERGAILQTWFCLTPALMRRAQESSDCTMRVAELVKDHRVSELQGVLLLRFTDFVVAEWSHLGRCRFWLITNPYAPKLFRWSYRRDDLLQYPNYIQQHYFSAEGRWQKDAAQWMAATTSSLSL